MINEAFSQGSSILHRTDPRLKLVSALLLACTSAVLSTIFGALSSLAAAFCLLSLSGLPLLQVSKRLLLVNAFIGLMWFFLPFTTPGSPLIFVFGLSLTREGIELALLVSLKSNSILLFMITLISTTRPATLGQALDSLHVPEKLTFLLLISYRYLEVIFQEYNRLATAARIRGFVPGTSLRSYRTYGYLLAMVLINSFDRAMRVYQAMLLRGFQGRFYALHEFHLSFTDWVMTVFMAGLVIVIFLTDKLLFGY
ncbi:MAG: cobalt ECF transporter T component CbiQ [Desulfohalobiaceae bacterium]|nr:cobalt ECF transporter T component CbiQ [Desulfohalobiaceae bacterium]